MHRLLRRPLSTPSFTEAAARLVRGATKANREARGATKQNRDATPKRPEATHKRAASIVQRKAEARVEHALAAAVAERRRRDAWRPPLDEVEVSAVRLSPDFREATVTWRLAESLRPPRSRFFADAAPPLATPGRLEAAEAALARVAGGLRAEVARRARLRFAPALVFHHDARRSAEGFAPEHLAGLVAGEGLGPPGRH